MNTKWKSKIKRFFIGQPLNNEAIHREKFSVIWGLPILASDPISSVAYAGQEMLIVLLPVVGGLAFGQITILSGAIIGLLAILVFSYRQTIQSYPNGGGSYIVSKDNLGKWPGLVAGAALAVDYILTVAVSISSGVEQIASAFTFLKPYSVIISVLLIVMLMVGNLRGIRESSRIFGLPTYAFIFALGSMIVVGFFKLATGFHPTPVDVKSLGQPITLLLMLRAFSSGCTALTGVEAVSNAVPNFKPPQSKNANKVLISLGVIILFLFGGTSVLANKFQVDPRGGRSLLVLMAEQIFGSNTVMYYFLTVTAFLILIFAANTAFADFPMLISIVSRDGYAPRQLSMRGDKLAYDNGIIVLSIVASILVVIFNAKVTLLISLYAVGVFVSFTLSQTGMFVRWRRLKGKHWHLKALINGFGAFVTLVTVTIIGSEKFKDGAWIVILLIPVLVFLMNNSKKHYESVKAQLHLEDEEYAIFKTAKATYSNHVIVPIESVNRTSMRALRYAYTIQQNKSKITAFTIAINEETVKHIQERYAKFNIDVPLKVVASPYRKIAEPLLDFIKSEEFGLKKGEIVTVILPKFVVNKRWHNVMHNHTTRYIEKELLKHKHIVVSVMPYQLKDDK